MAVFGNTSMKFWIEKNGDSSNRIYLNVERYRKNKNRQVFFFPIPLHEEEKAIQQDFGTAINTIIMQGNIQDFGSETKLQIDKAIDEMIGANFLSGTRLHMGVNPGSNAEKDYREWNGTILKYFLEWNIPEEVFDFVIEFRVSNEHTGWSA